MWEVISLPSFFQPEIEINKRLYVLDKIAVFRHKKSLHLPHKSVILNTGLNNTNLKGDGLL